MLGSRDLGVFNSPVGSLAQGFRLRNSTWAEKAQRTEQGNDNVVVRITSPRDPSFHAWSNQLSVARKSGKRFSTQILLELRCWAGGGGLNTPSPEWERGRVLEVLIGLSVKPDGASRKAS